MSILMISLHYATNKWDAIIGLFFDKKHCFNEFQKFRKSELKKISQ